MSARYDRWISAQEAAGILDTTSGEVCRLLALGRLSGKKLKKPRSPGTGQWRINPKSVEKERRHKAQRAARILARGLARLARSRKTAPAT
jgi:hypothetical protein